MKSRSLHHRRIHQLGVIGGATMLMLFGGCSSSPKSTEAPATPNPFSASPTGGSDAVRINTLRAFGDSYTGEDYSSAYGTKNWTRELRGMVPITRIENYAFGGARASTGEANSFAVQVSRWQNASVPTDQDLAVVYFGYNDVGRNGRPPANWEASKAGYVDGVARLVAGGAASGSNRIFVTQIHDWSRNPGVNRVNTQALVADWVNHVAAVANNYPNVIAVDLYTVFNRVMDTPQAFGITNVTDPDRTRSRTDHLFFDAIHFGNRGQEIIARTYRHYLTRGWNWANALDAGSATATQMSRDLDQNLLAFRGFQESGGSQAYRLLPLYTSSHTARDDRSSEVFDHHLVKAPQARASTQPLGLAMDVNSSFLGAGNGRLGVAITQDASRTRLGDIEDHQATRLQSSGTTLYWLKPQGNFLWSTQLSRTSHQLNQVGKDDFIVREISNGRSAHTWAFESKARYSFRSGNAVFTPWAALSQTQHTLDSARLSTLYTSDVHYSRSRASDTYASIGFDVQSDPIRLAGGHQLMLGGGLGHLQSLHRDNLNIGMTEDINPGLRFSETIVRGDVQRTQFAMNAQINFKSKLRLNATYAADLGNARQTQAVRLTATADF